MRDQKHSHRKHYLANREKILAKSREYRLANREKVLAQKRERDRKWRFENPELNREQAKKRTKKYRDSHPERKAWVKEYNRQWYLKHPKYHLEYVTLKYRSDSNFRLIKSCASRIHQALKGGLKSARTIKLLGCPILTLRAHLELSFVSGMTWKNYGPVWHVDHIRPCASFDLTDPEQQRQCFHYTNLQPLFALDNLKKGKKYAVLQH